MANGETEKRNAFNYCVSFIDLLGQRNAAKGQGLLPSISSEAEDKAFQKILRDNIGGFLSFNGMLKKWIRSFYQILIRHGASL